LPAYWLAVHSSFQYELDRYKDFEDIRLVDCREEFACEKAQEYLSAGFRILVLVSLHGDLAEWKNNYSWLAAIPNSMIFNFADEGDFGTHTDNQRAKLDFLFG
jgi:hypothetical protein